MLFVPGMISGEDLAGVDVRGDQGHGAVGGGTGTPVVQCSVTLHRRRANQVDECQ